MTTNQFLDALRQHPDASLAFEYADGAFARADFHLTEIKNVAFDTVDCGGVRNQWQEVHVQIFESPLPEPWHRVDAAKALKIFEVVERVRPTWANIVLKFEYGNRDFHTALLPVAEIDVQKGNQIIVRLGEERTTCKARDRAQTPEEKASACCGVPPVEKPKVSLKELTLQTPKCC